MVSMKQIKKMKILYLPNSYSQQRQHEKKANIYPVRMAMECEKHRQDGDEIYWNKEVKFGNKNKIVYPEIIDTENNATLIWKEEKLDKIITEPENLPFLPLPRPDRVFTRAKEYDSGNYKYRPGTHIMSASGCWWGKCSFCVENEQKYEVRPVEDVISEIEECKSLGFKYCFDDSATFPDSEWNYEFCKQVVNLNIHLGCNMRVNSDVDFKLMKQSGFVMLLIGVESANESTLNRINKGVNIEDIIPTFQKASRAGLEPHASAIIGFPFESYEDTMRTINLIKYLLVKGYATTAQMSFYKPPKNQEQGKDKYRKYVTKFYEVGFNPEFWYNKIIRIKSMADIHYLIRGIQKGFSALLTRRLT